MPRDESLPFERGTVQADGFAHLLGKTYYHEDINYASSAPGAKPRRSGKYVKVMLCKNSSGFALLPKRLGAPSTTAGESGVIKGYARLTADPGLPIDEFIPSAGVPDGYYFWCVVAGPAVVLTSLSDLAADVGVGDRLVAITGATSGATTSGRLSKIDLTGATAVLAAQILNFIGTAMTARTTQNTNSDLLVDVFQRLF